MTTKIEEYYPIIAAMRANKATQEQISDAIIAINPDRDISPSTVSRHLKKAEVKEMIRQCENAISLIAYPKATHNIIKAIEKYDPDKPVDGEDKSAMQIQEQGFRASLKIAEGIGLIPSNSMAPMVQQINVAGNAQIISPLVDRALSQAMLEAQDTVVEVDTGIHDANK